MKINYYKIVLEGINSFSGIEYLKDFLYREMKKYKSEDVSNSEFIEGCYSAYSRFISRLSFDMMIEKNIILNTISKFKRELDETNKTDLSIFQNEFNAENAKWKIERLNEKYESITINDYHFPIKDLKIEEYKLGVITYSTCIELKNAIDYIISKADKDKPIMITKFNNNIEALTELYNRAVNEFIKSNLKSWLYFFAGVPCEKPKQLKWLTKRTELRYFLNELCPDLESKKDKITLINTVFALINNREIDSNDEIPKNPNVNTSRIKKLFSDL